ncbi:MAG TPA: MFS transporter [Bacillota bacterium]
MPSLRPWRHLAAVTWLQTFVSLAHMSFAPLSEMLQAALSLSHTQLGALSTAAFGGTMVSTVIAGWLVDRLGVRPSILIGPALMAVALLAVGWGQTYAWLGVLLFIVGIGNGSSSPLTSKAIANWFPPRSRAFAMSVKQSGVALGVALGAIALPWVARLYGWPFAFQVAGGLLLLAVIASYAIYRDPRSADDAAQRAPRHDAAASWRQPLLLLVFWMGFAYCGYQTTLQTFFVPYLAEVVGLSSVAAAAFLAVLQLSGMVGRPIAGVISDRLQRRLEVLAALGVLGAIGGLGLKWLPSAGPVALSALTVFLGISAFGWVGLQFTLMTELVDATLAGRVTGVGTMMNVAGGAVGPILFGWLIDRTGSYDFALECFSLFVLVAALLLIALPRWLPAAAGPMNQATSGTGAP